jgi:pyruvate,orthophosphate dikinase
MEKIPDEIGTAANVQAMVFGNMGETSATGVGFTRNPSTGEKVFWGEFLMNAQGEDVVAGIRTPEPISDLEAIMPDAYRSFARSPPASKSIIATCRISSSPSKTASCTCCKPAMASAPAGGVARVAVEMVEEGLIDKKEAVLRVAPAQLDQLLHPLFDQASLKDADQDRQRHRCVARRSRGPRGFTAEEAVESVKKGPVILIRKETTPDDIHGMDVAKGMLTAVGGKSSHAAVVARGMGRPAWSARLAAHRRAQEAVHVKVGGKDVVVKEGDWISFDGTTADVYLGQAKTSEPDPKSPLFVKFMKWADEFRGNFGVRANADIPRDAKAAREVRRRRHRPVPHRAHVLRRRSHSAHAGHDSGRDEKTRDKALQEAAAHAAQADFAGLFEAMDGFPVIIRTLDPPLHEFLPKRENLMVDLAVLPHAGGKEKKEDVGKLRHPGGRSEEEAAGAAQARRGSARVQSDARLPRLPARHHYPEITEMQARAIFEAAVQVAKKGIKVIPGSHDSAGRFQRRARVAEGNRGSRGEGSLEKAGMKNMKYLIGTMIEIPRGALTADQIAEVAEFFSFGTNDLTQTTLGMSRDDYTKFSKKYEELKIFKADPFADHRSGRRGQAHRDGGEARPQDARPISKSASAASTAAIPVRWSSAIAWAWTTFRARPIACRSPGWRRRKRPSPAATNRKRCALNDGSVPPEPPVGGARVQILFGKLLAIGRGIDGVLQNEFVARQILGRRFLDLLQRRQHLGLGRGHFLHPDIERQFADQRVIGHRIDGLDDVRVILERVVNQRRAPGLFLAQELLQKSEPLARELEVQLQPRVRFLRFPI